MAQTLFTRLEAAGIPVEPARRPIREIDRDVFQMDIPRDGGERLRVWPGAVDNALDVLSTDAGRRQAVLRIVEPRRAYVDRVRIREGRVTREHMEAFVRESGGRVLRPRGSSWLVERWTDPAERRFLVGYDEDHLFAAQIPGGDSVREAHEALKPGEVRQAEASGLTPIVRQGEWFFVPLSRDAEVQLRGWISTVGRERRRVLPFEGNPHWVEELVRIPAGLDPATREPLQHHFVRGRIRHLEHATVSFDRWRQAVINAAVRRRSWAARGLYWID